ncbi:hypothetical protein QL285_038376 [Trifolium repens]|nr:hypothetical protein QL285_038376 [Trifolium repens]
MKGVTENGENDFYGVIDKIIEVSYNYLDYNKAVVLFYCDWNDPSRRGTKYNSKTNTIDIKMNRRYQPFDPFAIAHNVRQVYYVPYPSTQTDKRDWCAAITTKPRGRIEKDGIEEELEPYQLDEMTNNVHEVIEAEPFTALSVGAEEAEEVPDGGDVEEEDEDDHVEDERQDDEMADPSQYVEHGDPPVTDGKRVPPRDLIHRTVYNSFLVSLPSTDETGQSSQQQSLAADEQEHEDELINRNDLYDPPFQPQKAATSAIGFIIKQNYQEPWLTWGEIRAAKIGNDRVWNRFWKAFKMKCTFLKSREFEVIQIFDHKCSKKLSTLLLEARNRHRNGKEPPGWIGPGETWTELCRKWDDPDYVSKCKKNKQNRAAKPEASIHTTGSTSSGTVRIRYYREHGCYPTLADMNEELHRKADGSWDSARAKRDMIQVYIQELKESEAALPPSKRKSEFVLQNMIIEKFVEFLGGKNHGRIVGQGSTSSFIRKTPGGYIDASSESFNSTASMCTAQSRGGREETQEEMEARIEARVIATLRAEMSSSRNQSVQAEAEDEEAEDEVYRLDNVALNQSSSDPDPNFFNGIMNDSVMVQQLLDSDNFQMPGGGGNPNYFQGEGGNSNSQGGGYQNFQGQGNCQGSASFQGRGNIQGSANFQASGSYHGAGNIQGRGNFQGSGSLQGMGSIQGSGNFPGRVNLHSGISFQVGQQGGNNQGAGRTNSGGVGKPRRGSAGRTSGESGSGRTSAESGSARTSRGRRGGGSGNA